MRKFKVISIIMVVFITISISSCTDNSKQSNPEPDESTQVIRAIEDFESKIFKVMSQADLIPYYERQIEEKKQQEKQARQDKRSEGSADQKEFKPEPVTENNSLLLEIFKQENIDNIEEKAGKIPDDIVFIWDGINKAINELHQKWNDLKPELEKNAVSPGTINGFDETLNSLTISGAEKKYLETLINANKLTLFMSRFIKDLDDNTLASIYSIKYHSRQIVLNAVNNDYSGANNSINTINNKAEILKSVLTEKNSGELADKLMLSISDLENAVSLQDISVIKIKSSIVIKNINLVQEKITGQIP